MAQGTSPKTTSIESKILKSNMKTSVIYLETTHVTLREYVDTDFDHFIEMNQDPEVMRYLSGGRPTSIEETREGAERMKFYVGKFSGKLGAFTAVHRESGQVMGWFLLRPDRKTLERVHELELGYRLKKNFWGKGYATEVSRALVHKAFQDCGADFVFAQTRVNNQGSRKVMEKVGMTFVREFYDPEYGFDNSVYYRITRAEWEKQGLWQPTLVGSLIRLRPLANEDFEPLFFAASDPLIWEQHPEPDRYKRENFTRYFNQGIESKGALAIIDQKSGQMIGSSRFTLYDPAASSVEVGYTFLSRPYWQTGRNRELKLLMLNYAFQFVDSVFFYVGEADLDISESDGGDRRSRSGPDPEQGRLLRGDNLPN